MVVASWRCPCALLLCALLLSACSSGPSNRRPRSTANTSAVSAPAPSVARTHEVRRGDTLYAIARRHGMDFKQLARLNGIDSPYRIYPGQILRLSTGSSAQRSQTSRPRRPRSTTAPAPASKPAVVATPANRPSSGVTTQASAAAAATPPPSSAAATAGSWEWPTDGAVLRTFAANDPTRQGLKISGNLGQPVRAARAGQVVYSGTGLVGYGELVIVKHDGGYLTAYGHNRKRLVAEGDSVTRGQVIAELGRSGTDREMLHFEIRVAGKPTDPLRLLPKR